MLRPKHSFPAMLPSQLSAYSRSRKTLLGIMQSDQQDSGPGCSRVSFHSLRRCSCVCLLQENSSGHNAIRPTRLRPWLLSCKLLLPATLPSQLSAYFSKTPLGMMRSDPQDKGPGYSRANFHSLQRSLLNCLLTSGKLLWA